MAAPKPQTVEEMIKAVEAAFEMAISRTEGNGLWFALNYSLCRLDSCFRGRWSTPGKSCLWWCLSKFSLLQILWYCQCYIWEMCQLVLEYEDEGLILVAFCWHSQDFQEIDDSLIQFHTEDHDSDTKIEHQVNKLPWPLYDRQSACIMRRKTLEDGSVWCAETPAELTTGLSKPPSKTQKFLVKMINMSEFKSMSALGALFPLTVRLRCGVLPTSIPLVCATVFFIWQSRKYSSVDCQPIYRQNGWLSSLFQE